jgi:hypothetical protein
MTIRETRDGTHRDHDWEIRVSERDETTAQYGDVLVFIRDGTYGQYSERHDSEFTTLADLEARTRDLIDRLCDDDNIGKCDACGGFYNRRVDKRLYERELTWSDRHIFDGGMDPRYASHETREETKTCVWTTGRIFDTLHLVTHLNETNIFFDDDELVGTKSLVLCRGFERVHEDGATRPFDDVQEKYMDITRKTPRGRDSREKREEMLDLLDWVLKRADRFRTDSRFKYRHHR